eukprot:Amastigsp_a17589_4.p3 type:complete len:111 gc:universal Amastigsp_a17589_4:503-171(-)
MGLGVRSPVAAACAGLGGGFAIFLEAHSRRLELGLYMLQHSVESLARRVRAAGLVPRIPGEDAAIFAASMAVLMQAYFADKAMLRAPYAKTLRFFVGDTAPSLTETATQL